MPTTRIKHALAFLVLAGCSHVKPEPGIKVEYVEKPVIQMVQCVPAAKIPNRPDPLKAGPPVSDLETALAYALAKVSEWTRYGNKANAVMAACAQK